MIGAGIPLSPRPQRAPSLDTSRTRRFGRQVEESFAVPLSFAACARGESAPSESPAANATTNEEPSPFRQRQNHPGRHAGASPRRRAASRGGPLHGSGPQERDLRTARWLVRGHRRTGLRQPRHGRVRRRLPHRAVHGPAATTASPPSPTSSRAPKLTPLMYIY